MSLLRAAPGLLLATLLSSGLVGCQKKKEEEAPRPEPHAQATGPIAITVGDDGFKPDNVKVKKGTPATLVFTRTSDDTCATEVVFPQLNIKKELPKGAPISVDIPTDKEQTLVFQCGMGMYKSAVVVSAN
ncbi:MAG: hypothetical protein JWP97_1967 [Labilithrix sp.]|nr:hypothetical protein [Labilithrix sp.]